MTSSTNADPSETPGQPLVAAGDDAVLPFQLDALALRGRVARLDGVLDRILTLHNYPPSVAALVGEAALLTALIGDAMKLRGRFSLQARGDGPVRLIATDYFAPEYDRLGDQGGAAAAPAGDGPGPAHIRAYATFDKEATPETSKNPAALLGEGLFAMTIDQGGHMRPYQGVTPIVPGGLGASAEAYFAQSEQIATRFVTAIGASVIGGSGDAERYAWRAGGIMLQHMGKIGEGAIGDQPSGQAGMMSAQDVADMSDSPDDWRRGALLLDTVEVLELIGPHVTPEALLIRLFHEVGPRVFSAREMRFGCTCSREKLVELLQSYAPESLADMRTEQGDVEAQCQFCGARYRWRPPAAETDEGDAAAEAAPDRAGPPAS